MTAQRTIRRRLSLDAEAIRSALMEIDETSQESLVTPSKGSLYMPPGHAKALNLSASVVVGMRGTGKSYWTAALADKDFRGFVAQTARLPDLKSTTVAIGFALDPSSDEFPSTNDHASNHASGGQASDVWLAVVLWSALKALKKDFPAAKNWKQRIDWCRNNRESANSLLAECDRSIHASGQHLLIVFDALDRLANDWNLIRKYIRDLLQFTLECRSRRAIRLKIFLRPDMEEDDGVWEFVDSSKLRASKVELTWRPADLFGLVINYLANHSAVGSSFRKKISDSTKIDWPSQEDIFPLPRALATGEQPGRTVVEAFAGEWVGTSAKRGYVYTWVPTHLADARGRLSPRSFLLAFRAAAQWTEEHEPDADRALHFRGIQEGVAKASEIRVSEISEDYPWVTPLLEAARGLTVPCEVDELVNSWPKQSRTLLDRINSSTAGKLPPRRFATDPVRLGKTDALIEDLVELAIVYRTGDERINIPDIFRVGFGIKRMGGVRPPRQA
jgi:hypothetical protein